MAKINKMTMNELKSTTKLGDIYEIYYHGKIKQSSINVITRLSDKSVWHTTKWYITDREIVSSESRQSWNTMLDYINKGVYRKIKSGN